MYISRQSSILKWAVDWHFPDEANKEEVEIVWLMLVAV